MCLGPRVRAGFCLPIRPVDALLAEPALPRRRCGGGTLSPGSHSSMTLCVHPTPSCTSGEAPITQPLWRWLEGTWVGGGPEPLLGLRVAGRWGQDGSSPGPRSFLASGARTPSLKRVPSAEWHWGAGRVASEGPGRCARKPGSCHLSWSRVLFGFLTGIVILPLSLCPPPPRQAKTWPSSWRPAPRGPPQPVWTGSRVCKVQEEAMAAGEGARSHAAEIKSWGLAGGLQQPLAKPRGQQHETGPCLGLRSLRAGPASGQVGSACREDRAGSPISLCLASGPGATGPGRRARRPDSGRCRRWLSPLLGSCFVGGPRTAVGAVVDGLRCRGPASPGPSASCRRAAEEPLLYGLVEWLPRSSIRRTDVTQRASP